jgi:SWI/SNF-related matrix-associated actin-dependent regulator 1 of chromatin subfamily A
MLAERERPSLPPAPVLTVEPAPVDAAPVSGVRGVKRRLAEVEALARHNLRSAEEARRVVQEERALLEEEVSARTKAEHTATSLRRELERLKSSEEQRAAQAKFAAAHEAREELATEIERVHDEHSKVVDELDRLRGTLFDHDSLLDEYSRRLRDEQELQARAHGEQVRAEEALRVAERNLQVATESARRRADDDVAKFEKLEAEWRESCIERDRATAELRQLTMGDGELVRVRRELEAAREDMTRLMTDLDVQAARADTAESELTTAREALAKAEKTATAAVQERDLAGISLETTRAELAERTEALEAERSSSQATITELTETLSTTTRSVQSATERAADLEARLEAAVASRDDAYARADAMSEELDRARADAEQLRTHAVSIGDELAATHQTLDKTRVTADEARAREEQARQAARDAQRAASEAQRVAQEARAKAGQPPAAELEPELTALADDSEAPEVSEVWVEPPSAFDAALASAFGQELKGVATTRPIADADDGATADAPASAREPARAKKKAKTTFRVVEPLEPPVRAGGPEIELEASLLRGLEPVANGKGDEAADGEASEGEAAEAPKEHKPEPAWRRTAMAELTALATDSDDLTPRRRR